MGDDSSLDEHQRAEARVLNLDRTPWHMTWVGVRPQRARRRLDGARVSARSLPLDTRAILVFPKASLAPRLPAVPPRESPFEPRPAGTVPDCVPPWRHAFGEDSPTDGNLSRAGDDCGGVVVFTKHRVDEARGK